MATGLIDIMKRAALDAGEAGNPTDLRYGTVVSVSPLKVQLASDFIIPEALLIVPEKLKDYTISISVNMDTTPYSHTHNITDTYSGGGSASTDTHNHQITGETEITIHNSLKVGDNVALIREKGGKTYFILDRW